MREAQDILILAVCALLVVIALAVGWRWWSSREKASQIAVGRRIYAEHCASCHGPNLEGEPSWQTPRANGRMPAPPHDASGHTWHHSGQELFRITKFGMSAVVPGYESDMPAFKDTLSDREIEAALTFIRSTWPDRERSYQDLRTRQEDDR